jgi:D-alanyl-D-alanine carboxypeptidase
MNFADLRKPREAYGIMLTRIMPFLMACVLILAFTDSADAKPRFSAIAIDARTGKILYANDADGIRHPASLTKVMTLYLLFEDLKSRTIKLDTNLIISRRASAMAPSKIGMKPGSTISVGNAIKALVTKSANDVAAAIGENLAGSEANFAVRMTKKARDIGMSKTTFKNASGLPNPAQVTTARDMATLSLRIQRDFPEYYPYFRLTSFTYRGQTIRTHNRLLGRFQGTDGIKTGYTAASGFNLTTSAKRGKKRIIGVVLGSSSGSSRNKYMMSMLDKAFPKCADGTTIAALAGSSKGAIDPLAKLKTPAKPSAAEGPLETKVLEAKIETLVAETPEEPVKTVNAGAGLPAKLPFAVKKAPEEATVATADPTWKIQIGAYPRKEEARLKLQEIRASGYSFLSGKQAFTVEVQKGSETIYRAHFSGFTQKTAKAACSKLSKKGLECVTLSPQS